MLLMIQCTNEFGQSFGILSKNALLTLGSLGNFEVLKYEIYQNTPCSLCRTNISDGYSWNNLMRNDDRESNRTGIYFIIAQWHLM
jgi:hypothetical protein